MSVTPGLNAALAAGIGLANGAGSGSAPSAGYIPFLDPLPLAHDWWWLSAPVLCLGIAMVYKACRMPSLEGYRREVALMASQILLAMLLFAVGLAILVLWVVPRLPVPS